MVVVFFGKEVRNVLKREVKENLGKVKNNLYSMLKNKMMFGLAEIISLYFRACFFYVFIKLGNYVCGTFMLFGNNLQEGKHLSNGVGNVLQEGE
jgi:hypothetical protein